MYWGVGEVAAWKHVLSYSQHHSPALVECYKSHFSICNAFGLHSIFVCFFSPYVNDPWPIVQMMHIIQVFVALDKVLVMFRFLQYVVTKCSNMLEEHATSILKMT